MGRFVGVFLMKFIKPRWVFLVYLALCIVFIGPAITQRGNIGMAMLFLTLFFESIIFPTIVALGMRGLGKYSKRGSGFIVGAVSGGAVVPPILGATADAYNSTPRAMIVPMMFFVAALSYAVCVNFVPAYRNVADSFSTTKIGLQPSDEEAHSPGVLDSPGEKGTLEHSEMRQEEARGVHKM